MMDESEVIKVIKGFDAYLEVARQPARIVEGAVDHKWTFALRHSPTEKDSQRKPPIRLTDRTEEIPIDRELGVYNSSKQEITFFVKGIQRAAEILAVSPDDLRRVVQLHEWAHALLHMGLEEADRLSITQDESQWAKRIGWMNIWYSALDPDLHESLAQLLTQQGLCWLKNEARIPAARDRIDRLAHVFEQLMRRAPAAYRIGKYSKVPKSRIIGSIGLLKSGGLVGADAWRTVVTW